MRAAGLLATLAVLVVLAGGCSSDPPAPDPSPRPSTSTPAAAPLLLPGTAGGCGDAYFFYVGGDDRSAVVVSSELRNRSALADTVVEVTLPSPQVEVLFQQGSGLLAPQCNDVGRARIDDEVAVVEGSVTLVVGPRVRGGGLAEGSVHLTGAVTQDGQHLPDLRMRSDQIGFYAG